MVMADKHMSLVAALDVSGYFKAWARWNTLADEKRLIWKIGSHGLISLEYQEMFRFDAFAFAAGAADVGNVVGDHLFQLQRRRRRFEGGDDNFRWMGS